MTKKQIPKVKFKKNQDGSNVSKSSDLSKTFDALKHKHYGIYGHHSGIEICEWTKKSLRGQGVCYKQKFYNVDTHRCAQISPSVVWCQQSCIYCWRPTEYMTDSKLTGDIDDPKEIIDNLFKERIKLLSGFGGYPGISKKKFEEAQVPSHVAISLSGEPTLYPKLDEMIKYLKTKPEIKTIFLVTNGLCPDVLKKLSKKNVLPTQLYLSIEAPNEDLHKIINRPKIKDSWKKLNQTIRLFPKLNCRKIIRFTLIKGINDSQDLIPQYVKLFEKANPDFLEIKSYMHIGSSRKYLKFENMPTYKECMDFSKSLEKSSSLFKINDLCKDSRIVLLKNKNSRVRNFIK